METPHWLTRGCCESPFRPSYQGWKQQLLAHVACLVCLLDLPIRDGNTIFYFPELTPIVLLDLPIRDGNAGAGAVAIGTKLLLDLPIRDGNDSCKCQ